MREAFHTRDIDSPSWYTKPDHDVIVSLSALRTNLPFCLTSLHARAHPDGNCEFDLLSRPTQLNVLADQIAFDEIEDLRAAGKSTEFYLVPACRVYLRDGTGYISQAAKNAR
jgi:hypothetical protein